MISEISNSYVWDDKARARGEDKPLKKNDHHGDTLRYGYYTYKLHSFAGSSAISNTVPGILTQHLSKQKMEEMEILEEDYWQKHLSRFGWRRNRIPGGNSWLKRKRVIQQ